MNCAFFFGVIALVAFVLAIGDWLLGADHVGTFDDREGYAPPMMDCSLCGESGYQRADYSVLCDECNMIRANWIAAEREQRA